MNGVGGGGGGLWHCYQHISKKAVIRKLHSLATQCNSWGVWFSHSQYCDTNMTCLLLFMGGRKVSYCLNPLRVDIFSVVMRCNESPNQVWYTWAMSAFNLLLFSQHSIIPCWVTVTAVQLYFHCKCMISSQREKLNQSDNLYIPNGWTKMPTNLLKALMSKDTILGLISTGNVILELWNIPSQRENCWTLDYELARVSSSVEVSLEILLVVNAMIHELACYTTRCICILVTVIIVCHL